jgi:hypothetical protein
LVAFGINLSSVVIDSRSSEAIIAEDIVNAAGYIRFFSIDGGHWRQIVHNDLKLAESVLTAGGVIALDDFLRPEWPDVSIGYFDWYETSSKTIVPFAIGFNKLYLSDTEHALDYQKVLANSEFLKYFFSAYYDFCGNRIAIFQHYQLPERGMRERIRAYLKLYHPDFYVQFKKLKANVASRIRFISL